MPIRVCTGSPTCPNPATYRGRCQAHARQNDRQIHRAGYHVYRTKRWRITRNRILAERPICEHCDQRISEHVHHITDLADGGPPYAPSNLKALCAPCHNQTTRANQQQPA